MPRAGCGGEGRDGSVLWLQNEVLLLPSQVIAPLEGDAVPGLAGVAKR